MTITCSCLTYGRVDRLNECIESFLRQDYPDKRMVILNTCPQQTLIGEFPNVRIINLPERPANLGATRNHAVQFCPDGLICTLDDDDMALPHYLSTFAEQLEKNPEAQWVWLDKQFYLEGGKIKKLSTGMMNTFAFTKKAWESVNGYNAMNVGEDRHFVSKITHTCPGVKVSITPEETGYLYCWGNGVYHVSGLGDDKPKMMNSWDRAKRDLNSKIASRKVPTGDIQLKPAWQRNYITMAKEFISKSHLIAQKETSVCIVELGRYGDIINILPVARLIAERHEKPAFMVSREFADVLDGVSYVIPRVMDMPFKDVNRALKLAHAQYPVVLNAQIFGFNYRQEQHTKAFNIESWRNIGFEHLFNDRTLAPVFDRRNVSREAAIFNKLSIGKPILLLKLHGGISGHFSSGEQLEKIIRERFEPAFQVIELNSMKCERLYDVLGLMDRASALVTIDTSILHLAMASSVPVVALLPTRPWTAALPRYECAKLTYTEAVEQPLLVIEAIDNALKQSSPTPVIAGAIPNPIVRRLFHAVEKHDGPRDKRKEAAWKSWDTLYRQGVVPCHYTKYERTANDIGDPRKLPYLKDVLKFAMNQAGDDDIVFFTNDDNVLHPYLPDLLRYHVSVFGACCSHRRECHSDIPHLTKHPSELANAGALHAGRDLFAFTKAWLVERWNDIPDLILGASDWDWLLASIIRLEKGIITTRQNIETPISPAEIQLGYVLHRFHPPRWMAKDIEANAPSQRHNRNLFREFAKVKLPHLTFDECGRL